MPDKKQRVKVNGQVLNLSNLDKILYPETKIIKAELIQYYTKISAYMLDFSENRLLSLIRYPDGIYGTKFYAKNAPEWSPDWINTFVQDGDDINYVLCDSPQLLIWVANLAGLEIHAMNSIVEQGQWIDHFVLDFDPPEAFSYEELRDLTIRIGELLREDGLVPFVKTSGSRGAHIYVPIIRTKDRDSVINEIKKIAKKINERFPEQTTSHFRKERRKGKILIDINRNFDSQTTVLPFSTRAIEGAPVSMPLEWEDFAKTKSSQDFTIRTAPDFIAENGYAWSDFYDEAVDLFVPRKTKKNEKMIEKADDESAPEWFRKPSFKHMLASLSHSIVEGSNYVFENKWDGIRIFVYLWKGQCKVLTKSGRDVSSVFPEIVRIGESIKTLTTVLDGELVVLGKDGKPDFSRIISRMHSHKNIDKQLKKNPVVFYVFDAIIADGEPIDQKKWIDRRRVLKKIVNKIPGYRLSSAISEGEFLFEAARKMGLEGIMMKRIDAPYYIGQRSDAWQKLKFREDTDCVILGYTEGDGDRLPYFGSLHIGEIKESALIYRGRVGTGFDVSKMKMLTSIFKEMKKGGKWFSKSVDEESKTTWFEGPILECEIQYASLTNSGTFREPVFKKLKETVHDISGYK